MAVAMEICSPRSLCGNLKAPFTTERHVMTGSRKHLWLPKPIYCIEISTAVSICLPQTNINHSCSTYFLLHSSLLPDTLPALFRHHPSYSSKSIFNVYSLLSKHEAETRGCKGHQMLHLIKSIIS